MDKKIIYVGLVAGIGGVLFVNKIFFKHRHMQQTREATIVDKGLSLVIAGTELDEVIDNHALVMLVLCRPSCPYCREFDATVVQLEEMYRKQVFVRQIDVGKFPGLKRRFGVKTVPFVAFFKKGKLVHSLQGDESARAKPKLVRLLDGYIHQA